MQKTGGGSEAHDGEERLSLALDVSGACAWELNLKTNELHVDRRFHEILGYAMGELPNSRREWASYHHPDELDAIAARLQAHLRGEVPFYESENRVRDKAGKWRWFFTRGKVVSRDDKGQVERVTGIAMDVTQRKRTEETLRESRRAAEVRNRIGQIFLTVPDDKVFGEVLQVILQVMESPYGVFGFIDEKGNLVAPAMARSVPEQCESPAKSIVFPKGSWGRIWEAALDEARPVCSNTPFEVPEGHATISRALSVPIVYQKTAIGVFTVANKPADYEQGDVSLLEELAAYVAPVLKARLERDREEAERLRSEARFRKSEAMLTRAQKLAQIGSWDWDLLTNELTWSDEMYRITGVPEQRVTWKIAQSAIHPDDRDILAAMHEATTSGEKTISGDFRIVRPDGEIRYVHDEGEVISDNAGRSVRAFGVMQDITERKQAEAQLRRERGFSEQIISSLPGLFYLFDEERFVKWNPQFEIISGYSAEELAERYGPDFFEGADKELIRERMQDTFVNGEAVAEAELVTKDGRKIPCIFTGARRIFDGVPHLVGLGIDITERKQVEEELADRERFLDRVIEQSPFATWISDADGTLQRANPALKEILGLTDEELVGKYNVLEDPHVEEQGLMDSIRTVFEAGETIHFNCQWCGGDIPTWGMKTSKAVDIEATMFPIHNRAGELTNVVLHWIDISARKRAEKEREELIAKLERQNAELERFTYTVSHDLKSPLITIKGYVGVLQEALADTDSDQMAEDLGRISDAADKMADLLQDLLELSRIGRLVNPSVRIPLGELASEVLELLGGPIEQRGVQVEISPDLPVVFGDRIRLREVLQNLVDNGVKYMGQQPRPRIEIGSRRDGNQTVCYVRDNGIGIAPGYHERIFGLFDQLDQAMEGSGIGMALVKRIIEVHGGRVWIESDGAGHGTSVCFTIPRRVDSTQGGTSES